MIHKNNSWTRSRQQHPIDLYYWGNADLHSLHDPLLLIGGVHGDEPEGVYLAKHTLEWLQNLSAQEHEKIRHWILITCLNPDGYAANQRVNGGGVDLNRNFPANNWSKEFKEARYNPGPHPKSEPEIKALVDLITSVRPRTIIHCHSWKPCIVNSGPDESHYAKALSESSGFEIVKEIGYPTPGSLSSYAWFDNKIPVICIEDTEHRDSSQVWPRFSSGLKKCFLN